MVFYFTKKRKKKKERLNDSRLCEAKFSTNFDLNNLALDGKPPLK